MKVVGMMIVMVFCLRGSLSGRAFKTLSHLKPHCSDTTQASAVQDLLRRLIGDRADDFVVTVDRSLASSDGLDTYWLSSVAGGKVLVVGSSGVAAATGCYSYLKSYCGCHISWSGVQLRVPSPLPIVPSPITVTTPNR